MDKISKKIKVIKNIKKFIKDNDLDGYIVPKNDAFFTEYSEINNLEKVTLFNGSAGFAIILKKTNYLFVDGRYTLQAKKQSGKNFKIFETPYTLPKNLLKIHKFKIGFDPKLFTETTLKTYFDDKTHLIPIQFNFRINSQTKVNKIFHLNNKIVGESSNSKINKVINYMNKNKISYLYISAGENVNWLLNIRGRDLPNSPVVNCKLIITNKKKLYLFINSKKINNKLKKYFKNTIFYEENDLFKVISNLKKGLFCIDKNTCSIFEKKLINSKFKILQINEPIYQLKSIKNKTEIYNTLKAHVEDGVALTKFIYWFKFTKSLLTEKKIEDKLESFRKHSKNYLYPSFDTIAGSGPNGAIIHYKSNKRTNRKININDILLLDSGGQYKWGTTDVTRTIGRGKIADKIKNNFTRVLKGHIAVVTANLKRNCKGYLLDKLARKPLKSVGLDYSHGTGHGVGFFLNVHEGPQAISKYNKVKLKKGMILSNEPGYYLNNKYGIRIENLIYIDGKKENLTFKNLTFVPIDIDMINFKLLTKKEREYLFNYHLNTYAITSKFLSKSEKKWLINLIN